MAGPLHRAAAVLAGVGLLLALPAAIRLARGGRPLGAPVAVTTPTPSVSGAVELLPQQLSQDQLRDAKSHLEAALLVEKRRAETSRLLQMLGNVERDMGRIDKAMTLYTQARELRDETGSLASLLNDIGRAHLLRAELGEALARFREAARQPVVVRNARAVPEFSDSAGAEAAAALGNVGLVLQTQGDTALALEYYERALLTQERILGARHPDVALTRASIARAQHDLGRMGQAMQTIGEAEALMGSPRQRLEMASVLRVKSDLLRQGGRPADGEVAAREALSILLSHLGSEGGGGSPLVAATLNTLASALHDQRRHTEAMAKYRQALDVFASSVGDESLDAAAAHSNLGSLYRDLGDDSAALLETRKALAIQLRALGPESEDVGNSYNNLATVLLRQGSVEEAESLFAKAMAAVEGAKVPESSPFRQVYAENHRAALEKLRRRPRAGGAAASV